MKESQRVLVTKGLLKEALLNLMEGSHINQITVAELCRKAGVNRNTFYSHYNSPEDLLFEIEQSYSDKIFQIIEKTIPRDDYYLVLLKTLEAIAEEPQATRILVQNTESTYFSQFIATAFEKVTTIWAEHHWKTNAQDKAMIYRFTTGGAEWVVSNWLKDGMKIPPETLARKLAQLTEDIYEKYSKMYEI